MGFFSNLFAKQNCAVCGKECGTLHRSKLRDGQFLCDDCGNKCSKYIRLSELTLDEAKEFDMAQTEAILETARACHDAGITTLAFTGNEDSELAKTADAIFTIHDDHPMDLKNVKPNCFTGSCILAFEELLSICLDNLKQEGLAP